MKQGRISETIENRSVLKYIRQLQKTNTSGAEQTTDCALFSCQTVTFPVAEALLMRHAIYAAVNDLAAKGFATEGITCAVTLPLRVRESKLKQMMEEAVTICRELSCQIETQQVLVTESVNCPVVTITAFGRQGQTESEGARREKSRLQSLTKGAMAGADILVTKYIGGQGVSLVAHKKEEELLTRFPKALVTQGKEFSSPKALSILPEVKIARQQEGACMVPIYEGGIFAALWNLAKLCGTGLNVELKKIPMKQTIVEICNFYDMNPYELLSSGCLLIAAWDGKALAGKLLSGGIPAAVIGRLTDDNDKIIQNDGEIRYLDLPKPDQIRGILSTEKGYK